MFKAFLVKYSEIGVKGKNRYIFENALRDQVKLALDKVEGEFEQDLRLKRIECVLTLHSLEQWSLMKSLRQKKL